MISSVYDRPGLEPNRNQKWKSNLASIGSFVGSRTFLPTITSFEFQTPSVLYMVAHVRLNLF